MSEKELAARRPRGRPKKSAMPDWSRESAAPKQSGAQWDQPAAGQPKASGWAKKFAQVKWSGEFASPNEDRLRIAPEVLAEIDRNGFVIEWKCRSVFGKDMQREIGIHERNGWQTVGANSIPGVRETSIDGLELMIRPKAIHEKAKSLEKMEALERLATMEQRFKGQGLDVPGGSHVSAIKSNRIGKSIERVEIPRD